MWQIILRNEIVKNNNLFKVTGTLIFELKRAANCKKKKNSNANVFLLHYEPWHIQNPGIFIIRDIFKTLKYSKVRRYLHPCQTNFNVFQK